MDASSVTSGKPLLRLVEKALLPEDDGWIKLLLSGRGFNPFAIPKVSGQVGFDGSNRIFPLKGSPAVARLVERPRVEVKEADGHSFRLYAARGSDSPPSGVSLARGG